MIINSSLSDSKNKEVTMNANTLAPPHGPEHHPIPPHQRRNLLYVEFDEQDKTVLEMVFGDPDSAYAAMRAFYKAPPEQQIITIQILMQIEEVIYHEN